MRNWKVFIEDIYKSINRILEYINGMDLKTLVNDYKTYDAVLRNLEIIGEAAKNIPEDVKAKYNMIEWAKIAGLRNIAINDYFGVNDEIVGMYFGIKSPN